MLNTKFEGGFTLLEMMVALVIVSVGLLGVASLQTRGQQFIQVSYVRTQATFLASDILERIRINTDKGVLVPDNGDNGSYRSENCSKLSASGDECDGGTGTSCTPAALAAYDLAQWCRSLTSSKMLPNPEVTITFTFNSISNLRIYTITMCWGNAIANNLSTIEACNGKEGDQWTLQL